MFLYGASFYLCQCLLVQVMFQMWGTGLWLPAVLGEPQKTVMLLDSSSLSSLSPSLSPPFAPLWPTSIPPFPFPQPAVCNSKMLFSLHPTVLSPTAWRWWPHHSAGVQEEFSPLCPPSVAFPQDRQWQSLFVAPSEPCCIRVHQSSHQTIWVSATTVWISKATHQQLQNINPMDFGASWGC